MTVGLISSVRPKREQRPRPETIWFWQKWLRSASQVDRDSAQNAQASADRHRMLDLRSAPDNLVMNDLLGL